MRVIGVDPGSAVTGFGVVEGEGGALRHVGAGTIRTSGAGRGAPRLHAIYHRLLEVIDELEPATMSLERSFVAVNVQSAFRLGEARAVAMLAAAERGLELAEYTPAEVKLAIAGHGRADKQQVGLMVRRALELDSAAELADDAADALALAIYHLVRTRFEPAERRATGLRLAGTRDPAARPRPLPNRR